MSVPLVASGAVPAMTKMLSSSWTAGYGRSMTPSTQLSTAVLAPIPSVRHRIAIAENPGFRHKRRRPNRMSCSMDRDLLCRAQQGIAYLARQGRGRSEDEFGCELENAWIERGRDRPEVRRAGDRGRRTEIRRVQQVEH